MTEIDGRNRYRSGGQLILPAVCARWPRGASALRASARRLAVARRVGGQALAFLAETARYLHRHEQPDETPASLPTVWRGRGITAGWRRKGPWQAVLSGICPRQRSGRFLTDMAHLVGLYHNRLGLVAGGGSSKDDPQWATFTVSPADGGAPLWQPEAAELRMEQGEDSLLLRYGKSRAEVGVSLTTDAARIHFTLLSAAGSVTARLLRPLPSGARLCSPDGEAVLDIAQPVTVDCQAAAALVVEGAVYSLPAGARFVWPRMPFNPYSRDGKAESGEAFGAFEVTLDRRRPSQFIGVSAA
jgi:hypothetical protein